MENKSSSSLSSLDNITDNKIIFDKRTKNIINNNLNSDLCTITLTLDLGQIYLRIMIIIIKPLAAYIMDVL